MEENHMIQIVSCEEAFCNMITLFMYPSWKPILAISLIHQYLSIADFTHVQRIEHFYMFQHIDFSESCFLKLLV